MADGKQRDAWAHTSSLMALLVNINRDPKRGRAVKPDDFNPFAQRCKPARKMSWDEFDGLMGSLIRDRK
jgi:hypothetical protein